MIDWKSNDLDVYLWDVGHGLSMTFITPFVSFAGDVPINRRRVIQIDVGTNNEYSFSPVKFLVEKTGLSTIDYLIISHPDQDHINDLVNINELCTAGKLQVTRFRRNHTIPNNVISEDANKESTAKTVYKNMQNTYIYQHLPHDDVNPDNFAGLTIKTDYIEYEDGMDINDASVVTNILFGNTQLLIPGDLSEVGFNKLALAGKAPAVIDRATRILVAPHHGRESAEGIYLVNHLKPHIVLASAKVGDEHTDRLYSQSQNIQGHNVVNDSGTITQYRFLATKGQVISLKIVNDSPIIKKISYK